MRVKALLCAIVVVLPRIAFSATMTPIERAAQHAAASKNPLAGSEKARRAGARLYRRECAACHGPGGEGGGKAPPLVSPEVENAPPGALFRVLTNGSLRRGMPSFAHLPPPQRWQIVAYLQSAR